MRIRRKLAKIQIPHPKVEWSDFRFVKPRAKPRPARDFFEVRRTKPENPVRDGIVKPLNCGIVESNIGFAALSRFPFPFFIRDNPCNS